MSSRAENLGLGIRHRGQGPSFHALGIGEMAPNLLQAPGPRVTACAVLTPSRVLRIPSSSPAQPSPALCAQPHLCGPAHGGSSHPSPSDGPGCPGHRVPAALSCSPSQGGSLEAGGLTGGVATGPGGRAWRGRGAAPGAAVAAMKLVVSTAEKERAGRAIPLAPSCGSRGQCPQNLCPQLSPHAVWLKEVC